MKITPTPAFKIIFPVMVIIAGCHTKQQTSASLIKDTTKTVAAVVKAPLTDSALLMQHLDSLPAISFPYHSGLNDDVPLIDLSVFAHKKLTKIPFRLIPTAIGASYIDYNQEDTTFDLVNTYYKGQWTLVAKRPRFIVVEVKGDAGMFLVTITHSLECIDAIRIEATNPGNNSHWYANRKSDISADLIITMHHKFALTVDAQGTEEGVEYSTKKWTINKDGHFIKFT
ncbi:hypothetical protein A4H97_10955 [Niastella yeongjuensis]|uniref:Uncharacterized protein n=1 Tax=Niastella yeongjuensis TaxID=354355 RepID=A0A1V9EFF9_9BACT|nr:hypothetical protein [Niastella yeongjuensis]OQP44868.1 hypothetical protein A4H97_10955 [Niastella yeongjuensis]SEP41768.1 hypothetical protein SAMN05660816_05907 [Niastella yeongjuensis]